MQRKNLRVNAELQLKRQIKSKVKSELKKRNQEEKRAKNKKKEKVRKGEELKRPREEGKKLGGNFGNKRKRGFDSSPFGSGTTIVKSKTLNARRSRELIEK